MKTRIFTSTFLAASLLAFGIGAAAQRSAGDQNQQDQTTQGQTNSGMMGGGGMMGQGAGQGQGMMGGSVTGMMGRMTTHHQQMSALMNRLMQGMAAIQNEKDPEALKTKLAEHQALLAQMQSEMMRQGRTMQMMSGRIRQSCPGTGDTTSPPAK